MQCRNSFESTCPSSLSCPLGQLLSIGGQTWLTKEPKTPIQAQRNPIPSFKQLPPQVNPRPKKSRGKRTIAANATSHRTAAYAGCCDKSVAPGKSLCPTTVCECSRLRTKICLRQSAGSVQEEEQARNSQQARRQENRRYVKDANCRVPIGSITPGSI